MGITQMSTSKRAAQKASARRLEAIEQTVAHAAQAVNSALNGAADAVGLSQKVDESPYGMVAAALAVGYVVGGGLLTPTTARLFQLGVKVASVPVVRSQLLNLVESAVDGLLQHSRNDQEPK